MSHITEVNRLVVAICAWYLCAAGDDSCQTRVGVRDESNIPLIGETSTGVPAGSGVDVGVFVGVDVGVFVGVDVGVFVGVFVGVDVGV
ncbi:MAG: hypothetical protein B6D40_13215, partial [Anaerolineae bacterium UTCFX3]